MAKFVLIGGGDVGRGNTSYQTEVIDKKIVELTGKVNPNFLFVGLASSFSDSYYDVMKHIYKKLGCKTTYLKKSNILNNPDIVRKKIREFSEKVSTDILAGGLVEFPEDVDLAIEAGATAVSTNDRKLWNYK